MGWCSAMASAWRLRFAPPMACCTAVRLSFGNRPCATRAICMASSWLGATTNAWGVGEVGFTRVQGHSRDKDGGSVVTPRHIHSTRHMTPASRRKTLDLLCQQLPWIAQVCSALQVCKSCPLQWRLVKLLMLMLLLLSPLQLQLLMLMPLLLLLLHGKHTPALSRGPLL